MTRIFRLNDCDSNERKDRVQRVAAVFTPLMAIGPKMSSLSRISAVNRSPTCLVGYTFSAVPSTALHACSIAASISPRPKSSIAKRIESHRGATELERRIADTAPGGPECCAALGRRIVVVAVCGGLCRRLSG